MLTGSSALWTNQDPTYAAPVSTIWCVESVAVKQLDTHMNNHSANITFAYQFANTGHDLETKEMRLGRRYGPLVDIYALGCIAFECCTLRQVRGVGPYITLACIAGIVCAGKIYRRPT
jgi:hypothetical protein